MPVKKQETKVETPILIFRFNDNIPPIKEAFGMVSGHYMALGVNSVENLTDKQIASAFKSDKRHNPKTGEGFPGQANAVWIKNNKKTPFGLQIEGIAFRIDDRTKHALTQKMK